MITTRFEHAAVDARLSDIARKSGNLTEPLNAIGEILLTSVDKNFEAQGRYASAGDVRGGTTRWKELAPATKLARIGGGKAFTKAGTLKKRAVQKLAGLRILQVSGHLAASFAKKVTRDTLTIGSNLIYAAIHHFGGQAGRGHKITIPARPMLVVQDDDVENALDILDRHLGV